tara:strand:+ start:118 stop:345 length:228 start_codon:yes stop_codon:yes gene_type:complete
MIRNEENKFEKGDLVTRVIPSHYTNHQHSDAIGVVIRVHYPLARVYFYDTKKEEIWNQKVLAKVSKGVGRENENR